MLNCKWVRVLGFASLGFVLVSGSGVHAQEGNSTGGGVGTPGNRDTQGLGTKGTIGYVCYTVKEGRAINWLANTPKPREFSQCMDEVVTRWKTVAQTESDESLLFQKRMQEWFLESYRSTVGLGESLGCQVKLREEWRRKLLESNTSAEKDASKEEEKQGARETSGGKKDSN